MTGQHEQQAILAVGRLLADGAAKRKAAERLHDALEKGRSQARHDRAMAAAHVAKRDPGTAIATAPTRP